MNQNTKDWMRITLICKISMMNCVILLLLLSFLLTFVLSKNKVIYLNMKQTFCVILCLIGLILLSSKTLFLAHMIHYYLLLLVLSFEPFALPS